MKKIVAIIAFFFFLSLGVNQVQAQELSLGIYPSLLEVMLKPGKTVTQAYQLSNQGEVDFVLTSRLVPFEPADEFGNIKLFADFYDPGSAIKKSWFSFQNADLNLGDNFVLKAGDKKQIVLKIKVPEQAVEDDYYLTLLFENLPETNFSDSASQAQIQIGTNLLLTVSQTGEPPRKAEIETFQIKNAWLKIGRWQLIDSFTNPFFVLKIKNTGRSLFKPMGNLTITGPTGQSYLLDLLPENILISSIRDITCFSPEKNQPVPCRLKANWQNKLLLGAYQAKVTFGLDKVTEDHQRTLSFIAFPFTLLGGFILIILIIWSLIRFNKKY